VWVGAAFGLQSGKSQKIADAAGTLLSAMALPTPAERAAAMSRQFAMARYTHAHMCTHAPCDVDSCTGVDVRCVLGWDEFEFEFEFACACACACACMCSSAAWNPDGDINEEDEDEMWKKRPSTGKKRFVLNAQFLYFFAFLSVCDCLCLCDCVSVFLSVVCFSFDFLCV
jgi:hypothetical protein